MGLADYSVMCPDCPEPDCHPYVMCGPCRVVAEDDLADAMSAASRALSDHNDPRLALEVISGPAERFTGWLGVEVWCHLREALESGPDVEVIVEAVPVFFRRPATKVITMVRGEESQVFLQWFTKCPTAMLLASLAVLGYLWRTRSQPGAQAA